MKYNKTGFCRYCGQAWAIESDKELTEEQLNNEATWKCKCDEAIQDRNRKEYKKTAETDINILFGEEMPEAAEFLKSALPLMVERKVLSLSLDIDGRYKAKMKSTIAGKIKVTKTFSEKWETEN